MARTLTSGIAGQVSAQGSLLGYLLEITTTTGQVLRLCSMDVDFLYNGNTFNSANVVITSLMWDGTVNRPAQFTVGDPDLGYWALVLNFVLVDAPVRIWEVYAGAAGEAQALWSGRIGKAARAGLTVQFTLGNDSTTTYSPRTRVQQLVNPAFLIPSGYGFNIGSTRWIIQRPNQ